MSKIIISESQYRRLIETGSNSAAMDLDIYTQPMAVDTSNGNEEVDNSLYDMISKMKELKNMFETGKKVPIELENEIFSIHDKFKEVFDLIKQEN